MRMMRATLTKQIPVRYGRDRVANHMMCLLVLPLLVVAACSRGDGTEELPTALTAQDSGWPRRFAADDGTAMTIYQPQVESWVGYSSITFRAAVSFTPEGSEEPVFGALRVRADTDTDLENRRVLLGNMEIVDSKFVTLDEEQSAEWTERLAGVLPQTPTPIDLDRLLAYFEHTEAEAVAGELGVEAPAARASEVASDVPLIFVSERPAILVMLDGEPVLYPVEGTDLMFAVNTNWDLFFHTTSGNYYLLDRRDQEGESRSGFWLTAPAIDGPWTATVELPPDFLRLPEDWQDLREYLPGGSSGPAGESPAVYAVTRPAELIVIDGSPASTPIEGTRLMWVSNTDSDLFLYGGDGSYYYLVSGRWFRSKTLGGPWELVTAELPEEFGAIPADHPRSSVLVSVPGTAEAAEAVRLAQVPTKATVKRAEAKAEVAYQGDPEFAAIEGTQMEYATNTQSDVIKIGDLYYLCLQGVWFVSTHANGPWQVTDSVAQEIYTIPPSSPVHHTTYVHVYDSGPDWVTVGYTAAYVGLMIAILDDSPMVVYGTGFYYPPYVHYGPHPVYYPYHHSYGAAAWYNPHTGTYGRGASVYGPYGGAGRAAAYNPRTGTYARGAAAYGPYGGTAAYQAYNPRTNTYRAGYRSSNAYSSWGEGVVERGDKWAKGGYYSDSRGTVAGVRTSEGGGAVVARGAGGQTVVRGKGNNVYAGKNGEVYRRGDSGWSKYGDDKWSRAEQTGRKTAPRANEKQRSAAKSRAGTATQSRTGSPPSGRDAKTATGLSNTQRSAVKSGVGTRPQSRAGSTSGRTAKAAPGSSGIQRTAVQNRAQAPPRQRSGGQNRSPQATPDRAAPGRATGWEVPSSAQDTLSQLDRDAWARTEGSRRSQDFKSRRSSGQSGGRAAGGRGRGGKRGRGRG